MFRSLIGRLTSSSPERSCTWSLICRISIALPALTPAAEA